MQQQKILCVIPARLAASRFPNKVLIELCGKPLLQWVWEAARAVSYFNDVVFAIDDEKTAQVIASFGGRYHMTPKVLTSGTDRLAYLRNQGLEVADVWVNWQADEPLLSEKIISDLLRNLSKQDADVWTLKKKITETDDITSQHIAKVVTDHRGFALYFSRVPIPYDRDKNGSKENIYYKHVGLYAYRDQALAKIGKLSPCASEEMEKLEQLRYLHYGFKVHVEETQELAFGIDLPEHQEQVELLLQSKVIET